MPWRANEAPSAEELLSIVLGVKHYTSVGLLFEHDPLSADNADCLARYLERAYSDAQQLIVELREHARKRRAEKLLPGKRREKTG